MNFLFNLLKRIIKVVWMTIVLILALLFAFIALILVVKGLALTIPMMSIVTLPLSNNYNNLFQGAFNGLGFIGNSWQNMGTTVNPYLLCLDSLFDAINKIVRFAVAVFGNIAGTFSVSYPSWWTARSGDFVRDFQINYQNRLLHLEQLKHGIIQSELATRGYKSLEEADNYTRIHALHLGNTAYKKEYARSFLSVVPQIICTLINEVADIIIDLIDLFSPFFLTFLDLLLTAINAGKQNEVDEFVILLVQLIFSHILDFLATLGLNIGQCLLNIPNSLILCMFPGCQYGLDDISDSGTLVVACILSPVCTVNNPPNAGAVIFECLHIQDIIDFGLTVYNGILSLQSVAEAIQNFFLTIWNGILSLRVIYDTLRDLFGRIASRFGISIRSEIHLDSPHMVLDRIAMVVGFERQPPYRTVKLEVDVLQDVYELAESVKTSNGTDYTAYVAQVRSYIQGNLTLHKHALPDEHLWNGIASNIQKYYSDKRKAFVLASRQMNDVLHLSPHDPEYIRAKLDLDMVLNPDRIPMDNAYNETYIHKPFTFDNSKMHESASIMKNIFGMLNSTAAHFMNNNTRSANGTTSPQSPMWMREKSLGGKLDVFLRMHNDTHGRHPLYPQLAVYRDVLNDHRHYHQIALLAGAVRNLTQTFFWSFSQPRTVTVPMIRHHLNKIPMARVIAGLKDVSETARQRMGTTLGRDRAARTKLWIARYVSEDTHAEMQNMLGIRGMNHSEITRDAMEAQDRYMIAMKSVIEKRQNVFKAYEYFDNQRFAITAAITGTSIGGTLIYSGLPISIVASLLPAVFSLAIPAVGLLVTFIPQVIGYVSSKLTNMITNFSHGGEFIAPDLFTNLITRLGPAILDMFNFEPSPFLIQSMFAQSIEFAQDVMDDVAQYAIYAIACNVILPVPLIQCPARPTKDDTANSYFLKIVFFPMDEPCNDDTQCPGGFCRRPVDVNDPDGCWRKCTVDEPCFPAGTCQAPPIIPVGNCIRGGFFNVTFDVDCLAVGYTAKNYINSNIFQTSGFGLSFIFSRDGARFFGQCMLDGLVAIRAVTRLAVHGYMLPAQGLFSGLFTNIPFVPSIVGSLRQVTVFYYFIAPKLQSLIISIFPVTNWMDSNLWVVNWFGIPSPFLAFNSLFRYDNYLKNPPLGSPTPADIMCPVLHISFVAIGNILNLLIVIAFFVLITAGVIGLIIEIILLVIFPILYIVNVSRAASQASDMHDQGMIGFSDLPPQNQQQMVWYASGNQIVGAPRAVEPYSIGAVMPTVRNILRSGTFANCVLDGKSIDYTRYIIHPRHGIPIRNVGTIRISPRMP